MLILLIPIAVIIGLLVLGVHLPNTRLGPVLALPSHRLAPVIAGVVVGAVMWYVWGGLNAPSVLHDEASYLLQARTFAAFHWAMPSPPLPEFFEQYHVFVTPTFASKYPPGHAVLMIPGIWLSLPGLMPILLSAVAGALLFMLARRVTNGWVAVLTLVLWLPLTENLRWRGSYLSENTTSALWLLGWWALLEWRAGRSARWLLTLAICVAWMGITRPFTALAFALPVGVVVLIDVAKRREWRSLVRPTLVAIGIMAILPLWNARTLGDWRTMPYSAYSKVYFPYDDIGFGLHDAPPQRELPRDMQVFARIFRPLHQAYTPAAVPAAYMKRWRAIINDALRGWRLPLGLFGIVGLVVLGAEGWFAVATALLLTGAYLVFAHIPGWTVYYVEIFPVVPFLIALGIWTVACALVTPKLRVGPQLARQSGPRQALGAALVVLIVLWPASHDVRYGRRVEAALQSYPLRFRQVMAAVPDQRAILFVHYASWHSPHQSLIANDPDIAHARLWVVYDRGPENAKLAALAPDRATYLLDEETASLTPLRHGLAVR